MADKYELASIFEQVAILLEMKGENPFKIRAYQAAANTLQQLNVDLEEFVAGGGLTDTKGIGKAIGQKIQEYIASGKIAFHEELKANIPAVLFELVKIPGLGPKKAVILHEQLGINSIGELEYACHENRLAELPGFGAKSQEKILAGIEYAKGFQGQFLLADLLPLAEGITAQLGSRAGVTAAVAGDIRRRREVAQAVELVVACGEQTAIAEMVGSLPEALNVVECGQELIRVSLVGGKYLDVRPVTPEGFTAALHYYTGSEDYLGKLRVLAAERGWEVGVEWLRAPDGRKVTVSDENEIYQALGLSYIPPELREGQGELEAAANGKIPALVADEDIRGVLHIHTTSSDGGASIEEMAAAVQAKGWRYAGISDHSRTAVYARGLKVEDIQAQRREIDRLNAAGTGFIILAGIESDILPDGSLDYPDDVLAGFDFVIASVHSAFRQSKTDMTKRIVTAMRNKYVSILGHPTGRILLARDSYAVDLPEIIGAAAGTGTLIEINASPYRLDLDWRWCRQAREAGVMLAINPDAHAVSELGDVRYGVAIARKGALTAADIVNTRDPEHAMAILRQKSS
jgi:DNA polymerase (family X)